jgi:hypothetical protein
MELRPKTLLDQGRDAIRTKRYSYCAEYAYVGWITPFFLFHNIRHSNDMGTPEAEAFLIYWATRCHPTMIYSHDLNRGGLAARSPLD